VQLNKCHNCKHFLPTNFKGEFLIGYYYGNCNKFLKKNIVTNQYEYVSIHEARENEDLCGIKGTKYKEYDANEMNKNIANDFYE